MRTIDILAVDVEGWELNVMRGLTLERYRPRVAILENFSDEAEYVAFMAARGYERWCRLEPNDVYVRRSRSRQIANQLVPTPDSVSGVTDLKGQLAEQRKVPIISLLGATEGSSSHFGAALGGLNAVEHKVGWASRAAAHGKYSNR